jgi:Extracellular mutant protein 11
MRQGHRPVYTIGSIPRRGFNVGQSNDDTYSGIGDDEGEGDYEESVQNLENKTPSRTTMLPIGKPGAQNQNKKQVRMASGTFRDAALPEREERYSSPLPERDEPMSTALQQPQMHQNSILRHNQYKQHVDSIPPPEPYREPALAPPLKVFSYHEVSEEEQIPEGTPQSTTTPAKRRYAEIDYDLEDLKGKSYVDLEQLPFLTDPWAPQPPPAVDVNGTALSLPQRLANLNKMRPEDQSALFHSLNDEENGEAGQWFVQNFQDELQRLMERRLERRKIALKYEMEVKKRETVVKVKTSDVDEELKELRKGGGLLIEGKSVERIVGTPKAK